MPMIMVIYLGRIEWVVEELCSPIRARPARKDEKRTMKHAIIVTGGKQYRVAEGDTLYIEKLEVEAGSEVNFDQVLAVIDGENAKFGTPVVRL